MLPLKPGIDCVVFANSPEELRAVLDGHTIGDIHHAGVTVGKKVVEGPTPEGFAMNFAGRQLGEEITLAEAIALKSAGMVAVFGFSDDTVEFRGAIHEELGAGEIKFSRKGKFFSAEAMESLESLVRDGTIDLMPPINVIQCRWGAPDSPDWTYETEIPHATFEVLEGDHPFCRGIVFRIADLK